MERTRQNYYVGIDLNQEHAMVSYYRDGEKEPETMSMIAGSEAYQIPVLITKRRGIGQWFFGDEARGIEKVEQNPCIDRLLERARDDEKVFIEETEYDVCDLLALFLKKLIQLPAKLGNPTVPDKLVIVLEKLDTKTMSVFQKILPQIGMKQNQLMVIDQKESFYYFAYHQGEDLWLHDVFLFDYRRNEIAAFYAKRNQQTIPQMIQIDEDRTTFTENQKDEQFFRLAVSKFQKKMISAVYLIGDGFDGKWMQQSLAFLCKGRRVFMGKNLYSKGACYAAYSKVSEQNWPFVYMGDNEMKVNVSLKVHDGDETNFLTLISAGENWYETSGECEVILEGSPQIQFWLQLPNSREAKIETLELADLPERPDKTTRLRILAKPLSDEKVSIKIKDLGFGELFRSSDKSWEYVMAL